MKTEETFYRFKQVKVMHCLRCGGEWIPRFSEKGDPVKCNHCNSPSWNKTRVRAVKQKRTKKIDD